MAIVSRSKRQFKLLETKPNPLGPGFYDIGYSLTSPTSKAAKILPTHKTKPKQTPEQANHFQILQDKENVVAINEQEELYVTEDKKKGLMQRSKTKRIEFGSGAEVPGPGSYNLEKSIVKPSVKYDGPKLQKSHILQQIFKSPYYQASVSIPDFQNENSVKDKPKPSHKLAAPYLSSISQPGYSLSKDQRFKDNDHILSENPGPGAYELVPAIKEKEKEKKTDTKTYTQFLDAHISKLTQDTTKYSEDCDSDDSIQYIKEARPGPGSYNLSTSMNSKHCLGKSIQKFGSNAQRFTQQKVYWKGKQFDHQVQMKKHSSKKRDLAFGRSKSSNTLKRADKSTEIGPGFYNDPRTTVNKINQKFQKGYLGNFGSNAVRFKPFRSPYQNRTDFYLSPTENIDDVQVGTSAFKSKTNQGESYFVKKDFSTENYYSQDFNTIRRKLKEQSIRQTEQVVLQPPFGSGIVRFNYKTKELQKELDEDQQPGDYDIPYKKTETSTGFTFAHSKAQTKPNFYPGPGAYQNPDTWNSKTHNVLFLT